MSPTVRRDGTVYRAHRLSLFFTLFLEELTKLSSTAWLVNVTHSQEGRNCTRGIASVAVSSAVHHQPSASLRSLWQSWLNLQPLPDLSMSPKVRRWRKCTVNTASVMMFVFAKDLTGCFSQCCVEGDDHWIYVCIFVAHDGERWKPPAYHSSEGFQHVGIFHLFEVKLESCVFWLADFFQAKAEGHHQQVVITSNICSWKTSCSGNVYSWSEAPPH